MPSETLLPVSTDLITDWDVWPISQSAHQVLDEGVDTHDGGTTCIFTIDEGAELRLGMADPTLTGPFSQARVRLMAKRGSPGTNNALLVSLRYGSPAVETSQQSFEPDADLGWTLGELVWNGNWSDSDLDSMQVVIETPTLAGTDVELLVTAVELVVSNAAEPSYGELPPFGFVDALPVGQAFVFPY